MNKPEKIKCPKCEYVWWTQSQLQRVTCPNCQSKVKRDDDEK